MYSMQQPSEKDGYYGMCTLGDSVLYGGTVKYNLTIRYYIISVRGGQEISRHEIQIRQAKMLWRKNDP